MNSGPIIVACIPAFNEEGTIARVVLQAKKYVDKVLVGDDGSDDLTGAIAEELGALVIRHERNMGYGAALSSLFREALLIGADVVVTLDGDGQHNPDEIPKLIEEIKESDADIIIGSRFLEGSGSEHPWLRKTGIRLITGLASNGELLITDAQSGFRAYKRHALESLVLTEVGMGVSTEILLKAAEIGLSVAEVPVTISYDHSVSKNNLIMHGVDVVMSTVKYMSIRRPFLFFGFPGLVAVIIGLIFWVWTFQIFTIEKRVVTNIALIALGGTLIGLMLMTTAVILWVITSVVREKVVN